MRPLLTVIIPTFNSSPYIQRCLNSILNQSFKNFEIVTVDDQSSDNTIDILNEFAQNYPNIKVIELNSKVLAGGARNVGIGASTGKYISFIDSDDWIDTNYYYQMINFIENTNVDVVLSGVKREYDNAKDSKVRYQYNVKNVIDGEYALLLLSRMIDQDISISAIVCNKLFKASFIKKHGLKFFENCFNEDDIFIFNAFLEADFVGIVNDAYYHLYQRRNSASRGFSRKHIDDLFFAFCEIRKILESRSKFDKLRNCYYAFFEKCLSYLIESLHLSEQDSEIINEYIKYAFAIGKEVIPIDEFIDYCGNRRIANFFY